jgi:hypothetical protein
MKTLKKKVYRTYNILEVQYLFYGCEGNDDTQRYFTQTTLNKYCLSTRHEYVCCGGRLEPLTLNTETIWSLSIRLHVPTTLTPTK